MLARAGAAALTWWCAVLLSLPRATEVASCSLLVSSLLIPSPRSLLSPRIPPCSPYPNPCRHFLPTTPMYQEVRYLVSSSRPSTSAVLDLSCPIPPCSPDPNPCRPHLPTKPISQKVRSLSQLRRVNPLVAALNKGTSQKQTESTPCEASMISG